MKRIITFLFLMGSFVFYGQNSLLKNNTTQIQFDAAKSSIEPITAKSSNAKLLLNTLTGEIASLINIADFVFPNKLMQEHFNENYLESDKYPIASFEGMIPNFATTDFSSEQSIQVAGVFTIHGKKQKKNMIFKIEKTAEEYILKSKFSLELKDYKIKIPKVMFYKIAEQVEVSVLSKLKR